MRTKREFTNREVLLKEYKKGRRDFSGIDGREIDLSGADLTGARMRWANLERANFTGAILRKADLSYSKLSRAIFKETKVNGADFGWTLMFGVNRGGANFGDALIEKAAWTESDVHGLGLSHVEAEAAGLAVSPGIMASIRRKTSRLGSEKRWGDFRQRERDCHKRIWKSG